MKKRYKFEVDCANCAAKVEEAVKKIDGVNDATVNFMAQKLVLDADDARFDEILKEVIAVAKKVEPDCELYICSGSAARNGGAFCKEEPL